MPKMKVRDLILKLKETKKRIEENKNETLEDTLALVKDRKMVNIMLSDLASYVENKYGLEKGQKLIEKCFYLRSKKEKDFNYEDEVRSYRKKLKDDRVQGLYSNLNTFDGEYYKKEEVKAFLIENNLNNLDAMKRYGYDKVERLCIDHFGPEFKQYMDDQQKAYKASHPLRYGDYLLEALEAKDLEIDLDGELDATKHVLDLTDEEARVNPRSELIEDIKENPIISSYPEKLEAISEIEKIIQRDTKKASGDFSDYRNEVEIAFTKKAKEKIENAHRRQKDSILEPKIIDEKAGSVVMGLKEGHEDDLKAYENHKLVLPKKTKEGIKKGLEKIKSMGFNTKKSEQGTKIYAFDNLLKAKESIILELDQIEAANNEIKQINDAARMNTNPAQEANREARKLELEGMKLEHINSLLEKKKEYDLAKADVDQLIEISKNHFSDAKYINNNIDVTRNSSVPNEYRRDVKNSSYINGLWFIDQTLRDTNITMDEFIEDPLGSLRKAMDEKFNYKDMVISGKEKSLGEALDKIVPITSGSKVGGDRTRFTQLATRVGEFVASIDPENVEESFKAYDVFLDDINKLSFQNVNYQTLGSKEEKTFQNIILAGHEYPVRDLLEDDFFNQHTYKVEKGRSFDIDNYLNTHEVTPINLLSNYESIVNSLIKNNIDASGNGTIELSSHINMATKAFADASLKYMQAYKIDPKTTQDPTVKAMLEVINSPKKYINDTMGFKGYSTEVDLTSEKQKLAKLSPSKANIKAAKTKLSDREKKVLTSEKSFDTLIKREREQYLERQEELMALGTPEAYNQSEILSRNFHEKLIDHCNDLKKLAEEGKIPEGFYFKRIEQVMAGAPLGKLKFFGNNLEMTEEEYLATKEEERLDKFLRENKDKSKEDLEPLKPYEKDNLKAEYKALAERIKNEKDIMIDSIARNDNKIFDNIKLHEDRHIPSFKGQEELRIKNENALNPNREEEVKEEEINLEMLNPKDLEDVGRESIQERNSQNPNRTRISIDLNESFVGRKSTVSADDAKSLNKEKDLTNLSK